jgi:phosphate starvation-inducible membrane PsiE
VLTRARTEVPTKVAKIYLAAGAAFFAFFIFFAFLAMIVFQKYLKFKKVVNNFHYPLHPNTSMA